jgi:hypothetical protein
MKEPKALTKARIGRREFYIAAKGGGASVILNADDRLHHMRNMKSISS